MKGKFITFIFALMIAAGVSLMLIFPRDTKSIEDEKRTPAPFPELNTQSIKSGAFMTGFEEYLNDRIAARGAVTSAASALRSSFGMTSDLGKVISVAKQDWYGRPYESYLIYDNKKIMEVFEKKTEIQQQYINALNMYAETLDKSVNMYAMIIPTQLEYEDPMYSNFEDSQKEAIDEIYSGIDKRYRCIDVYSTLADHAEEYIYFKTDHHWTADGAYEAYRAFCSDSGLEPEAREDYEKTEYTDILGSLYDLTKEPELQKNPDTLVRYNTDPENKIEITARAKRNGKAESYKGTLFDTDISKMQYAAFAGGDNPLVIAKNKECTNNHTLLIIKDSYANAFFPWIVKNYSTVIMADPRSYWGVLSDITEEYKPDDVLIFNYIFLTSFDDYCKTLAALAEQK